MTLVVLGLVGPVRGQTFPFTSGPIPLCETSTFTANVSGVGWLIIPDGWNWGPYLESVLMNITTDHPQTLQISLTSPSGTTLLLSEFNGAGGQNYTNTNFANWAWNNITSGSAPFTGNFAPQGGSLDVFAGENADGIWTFTVTDTSCVNGGTGSGGTWTPGWFNGGVGTGAMAFGFSSPPPPCWGGIPDGVAYICPSGSVDITSYYSGTSYDMSYWTSNYTPIPDPTDVSTPGWYQVEGFDPWDGCLYAASFQIVASPQIALGPDQTVDVCDLNGPVDLSALFTLTGVTQVWTLDGAPITTATAAAATVPGVYQLIGQNPGGCNDTALVTLNINPAVVLGADQNINICESDIVDLTALYNTTGLSAEWTFGGAVFPTPATATAAGVYTLSVTTADGCSDEATVTVSIDPPPALGPDLAMDLCDNEDLDLTALYPTAGLTSEWTLAGATVPDPTMISAGGSYRLVATNVAGCTDTALVVVTNTMAPVLGADDAITACEGSTVDLTMSYTTTGLTTAWSASGVPVALPTVVDATDTYMLVATNIAGCSDTALVDVTMAANPVLGADQAISACDGTTVDLTALYATGADAAEWTLSGAPVTDPTAVPDAGAYMLTLTNAAGCTATATVTLSLDPAPALGADQSAAICAGSTFDLGPLYNTAGLSAAWTLNGTTVSDAAAVDVSGNYRLVATNTFGCTDTAIVAFTVNANPDLGADLSYTLCPWQTVDLSSVFPVGGLTATYTLDGQVLADPTAIHDPGTYVVSVTDAIGCSDEASATVINIDCLCEADFEREVTCMQEPAQFTLLADSAIVGARWYFGDAASGTDRIDPMVRFNRGGEVLVTLEATLSCGVVLVERTIDVQDCSDVCSVWIPSSFSPDNDGINDKWYWVSECKAEDFEMQVFDRWGELIYTSKDPFGSWDGTANGATAPTGVYVYNTSYRLPYQELKEAKGSITLVR
ncbi:MAG: gliding motility-associated C-terminal domain-containing protein [Flavobacteriales bacterium]|nr:gliding motility-associated C-terminal domain-containing protein [Flavobacteriales bacterium]